jgi:hypothetical protein
MKKALFLFLLFPVAAFGQDHSHSLGRKLTFPDAPGYKTLKVDLHIHTVFSDGSVWPDIRVQEALLDGMDAISLTEHLEYQPHKSDIPHPDRNRSSDIALEEAKDHNLLIIKGSEITRRMPPGHSNAVFISDPNKLLIKDSVAVFREAKNQGAFTFWNHPNWTAQRKDGVATLTDMHRNLIRDGLLHGIEVVNDITYSDEALKIALDNNLTIMGTSDIHGLVDWQFDILGGGQRPVTLVFARERSQESIKEGLMARRTVVAYKNTLIGKSDNLLPLLQESLVIAKAVYADRSDVLTVEIENKTSTEMTLQNAGDFNLHDRTDLVRIKALGKATIEVKTLKRLESVELKFRVLNAVDAPKSHPTVTLKSKVG